MPIEPGWNCLIQIRLIRLTLWSSLEICINHFSPCKFCRRPHSSTHIAHYQLSPKRPHCPLWETQWKLTLSWMNTTGLYTCLLSLHEIIHLDLEMHVEPSHWLCKIFIPKTCHHHFSSGQILLRKLCTYSLLVPIVSCIN